MNRPPRPAPRFLIVETGQPVASMRRHGAFPHWIRVAAGLTQAQARVANVEAGEALPAPKGLSDADYTGVIITGSGAMVTERRDWSERTADWLRAGLEAGMPVFGICYGHQLLAHALGGEVGDNPSGREMGTVAVDLNAQAQADPLFAGLPARFAAQTTHLQTVLRPPAVAAVLARSAQDNCQAFRYGDRAWGVQFHPEFSAMHMRGYVQARREALLREGRCHKQVAGTIGATPHARSVLRRFVRHAQSLRHH